MKVKELIRELTFHDMEAAVIVIGTSDVIAESEISSVQTEVSDEDEEFNTYDQEEGEDADGEEVQRVMIIINA